MSYPSFLRSSLFARFRELIRMLGQNPVLRPPMESVLSKLVLLTPKQAMVEGAPMFLGKDRICLQMAISGTWEPRNTSLVKEIVREGDTVVDVGAHVGYYTLILSRLVGPSGHVYSFEPDPNNFRLLKMNIETNHCENVVIEQEALSDRSGKAQFEGWVLIDDKNMSKHLSSELTKHIKVTTLDDYFRKDKPKVAFMKIDIEGHEMRAIEGAVETINRSHPIKILTEFDAFRWSKDGVSARLYLDLLARLGFRINIVNPMKTELERVEDFDELLSERGHMGMSLDLLCERG